MLFEILLFASIIFFQVLFFSKSNLWSYSLLGPNIAFIVQKSYKTLYICSTLLHILRIAIYEMYKKKLHEWMLFT